MGNIDTHKHPVTDIFRFHAFRAEIEINTDDNWNIAGVVEIMDFTKIPYSLLLQFDAGLFRRMNAYLEHGLPTNLVATHIVNASRETQFVLNLIRNVMKQKELVWNHWSVYWMPVILSISLFFSLSAQLHIHANVESLQRTIGGKEYLPSELGGSNGSIKEGIARYEVQLSEFADYFVEDQRYGVNAELRETWEKEQQQRQSVGVTVPAAVTSNAPAATSSDALAAREEAGGFFRKLNIDWSLGTC